MLRKEDRGGEGEREIENVVSWEVVNKRAGVHLRTLYLTFFFSFLLSPFSFLLPPLLSLIFYLIHVYLFSSYLESLNSVKLSPSDL